MYDGASIAMSVTLVTSVLALAAFVGLLWGIRRGLDLFVLRIRNGRLSVVRGRPPAALLADMEDVLRGAPDGLLRISLDGGKPALRVPQGWSPQRAQRLRNVLGRFPKAQLRSGWR